MRFRAGKKQAKALFITFLITTLTLMPGSYSAAQNATPLEHYRQTTHTNNGLTFPLEKDTSSTAANYPRPDRLVIQIIDNTIHRWHEYDRDDTISIYLLDPESRWLSAQEIVSLLFRSREWEKQYSEYFKLELHQAINHSGTSVLRTESMSDNRTAISGNKTTTYPYNTIGYLDITFPNSYMRGTAFLIGPYTALTNAHNVYLPAKGGWCTSVRFSPGQYETLWPETVKPYGSLSVINAETNQNYLIYADLNDEGTAVQYDYAALFFDQPVSGITTFLPLQFNYIPAEVTVIGYPSVVRSANTMGMWSSEGSLVHHDSHCLYYNAYTNPGTSGSPVLAYNQQAGTYRVVAVHTFASPDYSGGPHLNNLNRNLIEEWLRWVPNPTENAIKAITLNKTSLHLETGEKEALIVSIDPPEKASSANLHWSSSKNSVAEVDANGVVTAIGTGSAVISVRLPDGSKKAECTVYVTTGGSSSDDMTDRYSNIDLIKGDLTGNRAVNVLDVTMAMKYTLGLEGLNDRQLYNADVNNDGIVNVLDITLMMRYALGIIDFF